MTRQIVLDTETTGLEPSQGHRIIEIGCVEMIDRKLTGRHYHQYIQPDREIDAGAMEVHGISNEFLADKPRFGQIVDQFMEFVSGAELVIHNAPFDMGFLNHELALYGAKYSRLETYCTVLDTLVMARAKYPGQKNNLDALCRRLFIDNSHRDLHGALLDSEILAEVYLVMTGGQTKLSLSDDESSEGESAATNVIDVDFSSLVLPVLKATGAEIEAHQNFTQLLDKKSGGVCIWNQD